mgnify:FL=1
MMNNPQHACASCCEFISAVNQLKHEAGEAKRLPTLKEAAEWINLLQVKLMGLETLATEIKAFTTVSVAAAAVHEAWRDRAKACHPDRPGGSHDAMTELNLACDQAAAQANQP